MAALKPWAASLFRRQEMVAMPARNRLSDLSFIADLMTPGKVVPVIDGVYRLDDAPEAFRYIGAGHAKGKVVITM